MPDPAYLADLNPPQLRAATFAEDRPLLVLAGAGTGKTRTLVGRVSWLIEQGVPPERILLLTFTRRAAQEMLRRVAATCGRQARRVVGGTFHAVGQRLLRTFARRAGLAEGFTVLDRSDTEDLLDLSREHLGLRGGSKAAKGRRFPRKQTLASIYSRCVSGDLPLEKVLIRWYPWVAEHQAAIQQVFRRYEEEKQRQDVLDFEDLLAYWKALAEDEVLGPEMAGRFDHVLVDEYQDTNRVQRGILLGLRRGDPRITVVGDDAQAIYGFRGASVENILGFEDDFPGAEVVRLEQSYRSTEQVLGVANSVMGMAAQGYGKTLWSGREGDRPRLVRVASEDEEAAWVAEEALRLHEEGLPLRQQAVLFRTSHHADMLEVELGRRRIPYRKFGGLRFTDAAHVKDVLAFLRVVENPGDQTAWFRVLKLLDGVGPRSAARVLEHLAANGQRLDCLASAPLKGQAGRGVAELGEVLLAISSQDVAPAIDRVGVFYAPLLRARYDRSENRLEDLDTLAHLARSAGDRRALLSDLALDPPSASGELAGPPHLDEDWLVLSTIHSAKGLEWEAVSVLRATDGMIPSDLATGRADEVEEERRLFYVAVTRAKRRLNLLFPQRYHAIERRRQRGDWHLTARLTRFIPKGTLPLFEQVVPVGPEQGPAPAGPGPVRDLRAKALSRWGDA